MVLAVILICALLINILPKKTFLVMWGLVIIRLLIPYSMPSIFSIYSIFVKNPARLATEEQMQTVRTATDLFINQSFDLVSVSHEGSIILRAGIVIWLAGMLVCMLFFALICRKCHKRFRLALPVKNDFVESFKESHSLRRSVEICQTNNFSSPITYGIMHPVILLPESLDWTDTKMMQYILMHEYVHIRRLDGITKFILILSVCVHWFNPLIWVMYILANRDIELACDEAVIRSLGANRKADYARMLIQMEEFKSGLLVFGNYFSKSAIEERIVAIMKMKRGHFFQEY